MTKPFDPFTATLEEAQAEPDAYAVRGAVHRYYGAQVLLDRRDYYMQHILEGVAVCMLHDLVAPRWLAARFLQAQSAVKWAELGSWDEAFGAPHPKGTQLAALRRRMRARVRVVNVVREFVQRHPGESVESLYRAASATGSDRAIGPIGEYALRLGVGKTLAEELYREAIAMGIAIPVAELRRRMAEPERLAPAKSRKLAGVRNRR